MSYTLYIYLILNDTIIHYTCTSFPAYLPRLYHLQYETVSHKNLGIGKAAYEANIHVHASMMLIRYTHLRMQGQVVSRKRSL